jgi:hypothetical protein
MSIKITENFTGYPDGKKRRDFVAGETPSDLPEAYAELLVTKGHAVRQETEARAPRKEHSK